MRSNLSVSFRALVISIVLLSVCLGFNPVFAQQEVSQDQSGSTVIRKKYHQKQDEGFNQGEGLAMQATSADQAWWRNLSQTQRNQAIVDTARQDYGRNTHLSCKEWVRNVVLRASHNVVSISSNLPNENGWYWGSNQYYYSACYLNGIRAVQTGWIVQMNWRSNNGVVSPHTFIVTSVTSSGMYVIECNWSPPYGTTVSTRLVSFSEFNSAVPSLYSLYYILGG